MTTTLPNPGVPSPMSAPDLGWFDQARCREAPEGVFFTVGDQTDDEPAQVPPEARAYCDICPVQIECLETALTMRLGVDMQPPVGVWGGTSTYQRRQISRTRERAKCPICGGGHILHTGISALCMSCGRSWPVA